jgi:hypothetical protein
MPKYKVAGPFDVLGHKPGETITQIPDEINVEALLASGAITPADGEDEAPEKVPCPACVEQELARPPKFDDLEKLQKHYADKHPALVAPDSLPEPAGKEE